MSKRIASWTVGGSAARACSGRPRTISADTAVRNNADLIVVICNDGAYGAEHHKFVERQLDPVTIAFDWPDFAPVAKALGGDGVTIRSDDDWAAVEKAITERARPLLIDLKLDPNRVTWDR